MKNKKPTILVTNDDGILAPGIKALVEMAKKFGEVVVFAPDSPQSAKGHALTLSDPLRFKQVDLFEGIEAYECSGTPVDCVKLAKNVVFNDREIDLCLSGINHGSNASINIIYSGTVSAAMEASLEGIDSIAFSLLDYSFEADFEAAKPFMESIISGVLQNGLESCKLLNVNIPKLKRSEIQGIKICRQAKGTWVEEFIESLDPRGQPYYWMTGKFIVLEESNDTDMWALSQGFLSVVPSMHDLTDHKSLPTLLHLEKI